MIPAAADHQGLAGYCDVFCGGRLLGCAEPQVLEAGKKAGLRPRVHADEVHDTGARPSPRKWGRFSAEHLLAAGDAGLDAMARAGVVANLLPATAYSLRKPYARARFMIERGLPVAVATDCNPGVVLLRVDAVRVRAVSDADGADRRRGAYGRDAERRVRHRARRSRREHGPGKQADFLLLDGETPAAIAYHAGGSVVDEVYKLGERVATRGACC